MRDGCGLGGRLRAQVRRDSPLQIFHSAHRARSQEGEKTAMETHKALPRNLRAPHGPAPTKAWRRHHQTAEARRHTLSTDKVRDRVDILYSAHKKADTFSNHMKKLQTRLCQGTSSCSLYLGTSVTACLDLNAMGTVRRTSKSGKGSEPSISPFTVWWHSPLPYLNERTILQMHPRKSAR